jgi:hypothetical protein
LLLKPHVELGPIEAHETPDLEVWDSALAYKPLDVASGDAEGLGDRIEIEKRSAQRRRRLHDVTRPPVLRHHDQAPLIEEKLSSYP